MNNADLQGLCEVNTGQTERAIKIGDIIGQKINHSLGCRRQSGRALNALKKGQEMSVYNNP